LSQCAGVGAVKDSFGKAIYLAECQVLGVNPVAQIVKYLEYQELFLSNYGIATKGLQALLAALKVRPCRGRPALAILNRTRRRHQQRMLAAHGGSLVQVISMQGADCMDRHNR
jgi:hypothetical protein